VRRVFLRLLGLPLLFSLEGCLDITSVDQPIEVNAGEEFSITVSFDVVGTANDNPAGDEFGAIKVPVGSVYVESNIHLSGNAEVYRALVRNSAIEAALEADLPSDANYEWWAVKQSGSSIPADSYEAILTLSMPPDSNNVNFFLDYKVGSNDQGSITYHDESLNHSISVVDNRTPREIEMDAMADIYTSMCNEGCTWNYNVLEPPCDIDGANPQEGIMCNNTGNVIRIRSGYKKLNGALSTAIADLNFLEWLELTGSPNLSGSIPENIGLLENLEILWLYKNSLEGEIPESITNLLKLRSLHLGFNNLSGSIPNAINQLSNLTSFELLHNELEGEIPDGIGELVNLRFLNLRYNNLSGALPQSLSNLTELFELILHDNSLSGQVPDLSALAKLDWIDLTNNNFTGNIPDLSNLPSLSFLYLSGNNWTCPIVNYSAWANYGDDYMGGLFCAHLPGDFDGDGLSDTDESALGTDPQNPDSDNDSIIDGWEVAMGDKPLEKRYSLELFSSITHAYNCDDYINPWPPYDFVDFSSESYVCINDDEGEKCTEYHNLNSSVEGYFVSSHSRSATFEMGCTAYDDNEVYCQLNNEWSQRVYEEPAYGFCHAPTSNYQLPNSVGVTVFIDPYVDIDYGLNEHAVCTLELQPLSNSNQVVCRGLEITTNEDPLYGDSNTIVEAMSLSSLSYPLAGEIYRDSDRDGIEDLLDPDIDNDGVNNDLDNQDYNPFIVGDIDIDNDGLINSLDDDDDGDGVIDSEDKFPFNNSEWSDGDGDFVGDNTDNCLTVTDFNQADLDNDGMGDVCDYDIDGDGVPNVVDQWPLNNEKTKEIDLPLNSQYKGILLE